MIKVSIVVPVYNVEQYIEECLESLVNQSLKEIEIIIVNDGTRDNSIELVKKIDDDRILIVEQKNSGLSAARNTGLSYAKGEYVCFVDSDDFILDYYAYENMYNIASQYNCCMVVGNAEIYYDQSNKTSLNKKFDSNLGIAISSVDYLINSIVQQNIFAPVWLYLYNRDFLINNELLFKPGIYHEDEDFTPRVLIKAKKIGIYNNCFYAYRQRSNSIISSSNINQKTQDIFKTCLELEKVANEMINFKQKKLFKNYIAALAMNQIQNFNLINVDNKTKKFIYRNSQSVLLRLKAIVLLINPRLLFISSKIKRLIKT